MIAFDHKAQVQIEFMAAIILHITVQFQGFTSSGAGIGIDESEQLLSETLVPKFLYKKNKVRLTGSPGVMSGHKPKAEDPDGLSSFKILLNASFIPAFFAKIIIFLAS